MSMTIKVEFSEHFNKVVGADIEKIADKALQRTIVEAEGLCQREVPVKTSTLKRSIGTSHPNIGTVCLTSGVKYWRYVQYGTAPHVITGDPLAWEDDDGVHFARRVNHPGTKANPFVTRTAKRIIGNKLIQTNINDMLVLEGIIR